MISHKFKDWWHTQTDIEQHAYFRKKAIELHKAYNEFLLASKKSIEYSNNRTGLRGGRFTTLIAKIENKSKIHSDLLEELNYIIKRL